MIEASLNAEGYTQNTWLQRSLADATAAVERAASQVQVIRSVPDTGY